MSSPSNLSSPPPPDSWPGAGGRRSVAPEVPSWPGASAGGTDSWPGASGDSWPGAGGKPQPKPVVVEDRRSGGVAGVLFPAVAAVAALVLVGIWVALDGAHRPAQGITFVLVLVIAVAALVVSVLRHRDRL